jgi:hypothetical protein
MCYFSRTLPIRALTLTLCVILMTEPALACQALTVYRRVSIPQTNADGVPYITWSFFLSCSPSWGTEDEKALIDLQDKFVAFGDNLGKKHAAIWFSSVEQDNEMHQTINHPLDRERTAEYCSEFRTGGNKISVYINNDKTPKRNVWR